MPADRGSAVTVRASLRRDVELMVFDGWSAGRIAVQLGVTVDELVKRFGRELEEGADRVRRRLLRNLSRASDRGNMTATRTLLACGDTLPAVDEEPKPPAALGKKEAANLEAQTAEQGTSWAGLLKH